MGGARFVIYYSLTLLLSPVLLVLWLLCGAWFPHTFRWLDLSRHVIKFRLCAERGLQVFESRHFCCGHFVIPCLPFHSIYAFSAEEVARLRPGDVCVFKQRMEMHVHDVDGIVGREMGIREASGEHGKHAIETIDAVNENELVGCGEILCQPCKLRCKMFEMGCRKRRQSGTVRDCFSSSDYEAVFLGVVVPPSLKLRQHQIEDLESDDVLGTCSALDTKLTKMRGAVLPLSRIVLSKRLMKDTFKMRDHVRAWLHTERSTVGLLTVAQDEP